MWNAFRKLFGRQYSFIWRYLTGDIPWNSGIVPPEITAWIDQHEADHLPPGHALDLGCGTGTTSRYLAGHGWRVVGLDFAPNAIWRARREARRQSVADRVHFISADVSRPDLLHDAAPFDLLVDVGCLHSLPDGIRPGYAANVKRLANPGATMLIYAFQPRITDSGRRLGIDEASLRGLLAPDFEVIDVTHGQESTNPDRPSAWYTLRKVEAVPS